MNTDTTLILAGNGYTLEIAPEAIKRRDTLLEAAASVVKVTSNDESADAAVHMRRLAQLRIEVDKSKKEIKAPVIKIGKLIDETARNFLTEVENAETRIRALIGDHATEVARIKAEKEEAERKAFEEARLARELAEKSATSAAESGKLKDIIAARQAEALRQETLAARMNASEEVATTSIAQGVRFAWDFEVTDIEAIARRAPEFVEMNIRRSPVLAWLKQCEDHGWNTEGLAADIGIRAFKKPVVSTK